jgi:transcriptional regulator with XRE-family HTH domain
MREARLRLKLSQQELADRIGIDQSDISKLELGKVGEPLFSKGLRIADALNLDPRALTFSAESGA